jgi:hypothetical protein
MPPSVKLGIDGQHRLAVCRIKIFTKEHVHEPATKRSKISHKSSFKHPNGGVCSVSLLSLKIVQYNHDQCINLSCSKTDVENDELPVSFKCGNKVSRQYCVRAQCKAQLELKIRTMFLVEGFGLYVWQIPMYAKASAE